MIVIRECPERLAGRGFLRGFRRPLYSIHNVIGGSAMMASRMSEPVAAIEPRQLKAMLRDGRELALLDVREEGVFARSHLLFATPIPLSRLELELAALVPRRSTRVVLVDDADGLAKRAAALMMRFEYTDISTLAGGVAAWQAAGYELFSGVHVPSKAF